MEKNKLILILLVITFLAGVIIYGFSFTVLTNDLGLTKSDLAIGELHDFEALRAKTIKVADSYLSQHAAKFNDICHDSCELKLNYSLKGKIRPFGYRSSFYYSHWNIYLPYSTAGPDNKYIFIVQVADVNGNINDPNNKFDVVRAIIIDSTGAIVRQVEGK
ncbi:MAG: hypothetical protein V1699_05370 [Candidatus Omnitrophota bacterium]